MTQLPLLPEARIEVTNGYDRLSNQHKQDLDAIIKTAVQTPLLIGGYSNETTESRRIRLRNDLWKEPNYFYLIIIQGKLIGAAKIWDGWLPVECEYVMPAVELAVLDPEYSADAPFVRRKLYEYLDTIEKEQGW